MNCAQHHELVRQSLSKSITRHEVSSFHKKLPRGSLRLEYLLTYNTSHGKFFVRVGQDT